MVIDTSKIKIPKSLKYILISLLLLFIIWEGISLFFGKNPYKLLKQAQIEQIDDSKEETLKLQEEFNKFKKEFYLQKKKDSILIDSLNKVNNWKFYKIKQRLNEIDNINYEANKKISDASDDSVNELRDSVFTRLRRLEQMQRTIKRRMETNQ